MNKTELREHIREQKILEFVNNELDYYKFSGNIYVNVINFPKFRQNSKIAIFASKESSFEPVTDKIINESIIMKKEIFIPRCLTEIKNMEFIKINSLEHDTEIATFAIREPRKELAVIDQTEFKKNLDIIFVPGMAFDIYGNRLGYGGGYYDNFLNSLLSLNPNVTIIGLTFNFQFLNEEIPHNKHDIKVEYVITETGIFKTSKK